MQKFKKLYVDSLAELKVTKNMVICAFMAALAIVLSYTTSIEIGPYIRVGFSGLPNRIVEFLFGPVIGCIFGGTLDILKYFLKPSGPFFFGFTFDAMLAGILFGSLVYKKPLKLWRVVLAEFLIKLIVNCGFNTLWISLLYGKGFMVLLPARVLKNAVMLPIDSAIVFFSFSLVQKLKAYLHI